MKKTNRKTAPERKEKTLYWLILGRPQGTTTWMAVPYIPRKGRCGNHFSSEARALKCAAHLADRANPTWLPKEKSWVPIQYTVARVVIPIEPSVHSHNREITLTIAPPQP
jgi:hypothetical protein